MVVEEPSPCKAPQRAGRLARLWGLRARYGWLGLARRATAKTSDRLRATWRRIAQHRNHVFVYDPSARRVAGPIGMEVIRYTLHSDIPRPIREAMAREQGDRSIDSDRWEMEHHAVLWVALVDGHFAGMSMSRRGCHYLKWFVPLRDCDVVIFRNWTAPAFRGQEVCPALMQRAFACEQAGDGRAYVDCKVYNKPSIRSIKKAGFRRIATMKPVPLAEQF